MTEEPPIGLNPIRARESVRLLLARDEISPNRLIQVLIVKDSTDGTEILPSTTCRTIGERARALYSLGIRAIKLFAREIVKDPTGVIAEKDESLCAQAIRAVKDAEPRMAVITETCICSATGGSCVILGPDNRIDPARTLDRFRCIALMQARNGADILGPAAMTDGAVSAVREALDGDGRFDVALMPHVEFRSELYAAYRRAAGTGSGVHRHGFQIAVEHGGQFQAAAHQMANEGADMLLVEPGMFYLDTIAPIKLAVRRPVGIFSVSGEYLMLAGLGAERIPVVAEYFRSAMRAGGDFIVTYSAEEYMLSTQ